MLYVNAKLASIVHCDLLAWRGDSRAVSWRRYGRTGFYWVLSGRYIEFDSVRNLEAIGRHG